MDAIVARIRRNRPHSRIIVRGDSFFIPEDLVSRREAEQVDYVLGLAKNIRLAKATAKEWECSQVQHEATTRWRDYSGTCGAQILETWFGERRKVAKVEASRNARIRFSS